MKRVLSLLLVLSLCAAALLAFSACDLSDAEKKLGELNEEEWEEAFAPANFENVTVRYEYILGTNLQKQVMKMTDEGVYRSIEFYNKENNELLNKLANFFEGTTADMQRTLFLQTFLGIVEDKENFEYDETEKVYKADDVEIRIDQAEGIYVVENIKNGKLTFNEDGTVKNFVCTLTESQYMNGEQKESVTTDVTWTFSDYETTKITAEEKEADSPLMGG